VDSQKQLGQNIKKARKKAGLTQLDVAEKSAISVNYFARIERGEVNPSMDILEQIAKALKVKSSEILPF